MIEDFVIFNGLQYTVKTFLLNFWVSIIKEDNFRKSWQDTDINNNARHEFLSF